MNDKKIASCGVDVIVNAVNMNSDFKVTHSEIQARYYIDKDGITIETMVDILRSIGFNIKVSPHYVQGDNAIYLVADGNLNHYIYRYGKKIIDQQNIYQDKVFYSKVIYTITIHSSTIEKFKKRKKLSKIIRENFKVSTLTLTITCVMISFVIIWLYSVLRLNLALTLVLSLASTIFYFLSYEVAFFISTKYELTKLFKWISSNLVETNAAEFYGVESKYYDLNEIKKLVKQNERKLNDWIFVCISVMWLYFLIPISRGEFIVISILVVAYSLLCKGIKIIDFESEWISITLTLTLSVILLTMSIFIWQYMSWDETIIMYFLPITEIVIAHIYLSEQNVDVERLDKIYFFSGGKKINYDQQIHQVFFKNLSFQKDTNLTKKISYSFKNNSVIFMNSWDDIKNVSGLFSGKTHWYNGRVLYNLQDSRELKNSFYQKNVHIVNMNYKSNKKIKITGNIDLYSEMTSIQKNIIDSIISARKKRIIFIPINTQYNEYFCKTIDGIIQKNFTNSMVILATNNKEIYHYDWHFVQN